MSAWIAKDLPDDFLDGGETNFKIRGSSGKLNIALDGLPTFRGVPEGCPALTGEKHFSDTMERIEKRLRRLEGRHLVQGPLSSTC